MGYRMKVMINKKYLRGKLILVLFSNTSGPNSQLSQPLLLVEPPMGSLMMYYVVG